MNSLNILDLFAGEGGEERRSKIESRGHKYTTLDIEGLFNCDITIDIMEIKSLEGYDFIWASVPCETWSVASIGHHWNKDNTPKTKEAEKGIALVKHTIKLIKKSAKIGWLIENPRGKLRKMPFMQNIQRFTVTYCQYGDTRMKPTDLWGVLPNWNPRPVCKNGDSCHVSAPRGSKTGTQGIKGASKRAIVPWGLWLSVIEALEKK